MLVDTLDLRFNSFEENMSEDKTLKIVKPSQVYCEVCSVYVSSASLLATHIKGKKHQQLQKLREAQDQAARLSVYVSGFKCSETNEDEMSTFLNSFGKVNNIYFDKNKGAFAIIEFEDEKAVLDILEKKEPIVFKGKHLKIKKRTFTKQKSAEQQETSTGEYLQQNQKKRKKRHSSESNATSFLAKEISDKLKQLTSVNQQIDLLMNKLQLTDEDIQLRSLICSMLEEVFKEFSPSVKVLLYGSSASGLGCKGSDLDITILIDKDTLDIELDSEDTEAGSATQAKGSKVYSFIVKVIKSLVPGCSHVIPIYSAKCPVIKFTHQSSGLSCDLTVNNRLGIQNTKLLRCYMSLDSRIPQLVYTIRAWAKALGISGGQLTSYALTLMVIYFLQTTDPPVIPSLQNISGWPIRAERTNGNENDDQGRDNQKSCTIDGWDCSFFEDITALSLSLNSKPVDKILEEFFDFYSSKFDYGNCAVNIRKGKRCTILSLEEELQEIENTRNDDETKEKSPENIQELTEQKEEGTVWKTTPFCVQDPFELSHNVTQNIGVSSLRNIIHCMTDACRVCSTFPSDGRLTDSDGIMSFFRNPSKMSTKRKKRDGYSFSVYVCNKNESDAASSLKIPGIVCPKYSTSEELFDAFCKYLEEELQMKCEFENNHGDQNSTGQDHHATCTALTNTWTHCRRERRKSIKGKDELLTASDVEKSHSTLCDTSLSQDSETKIRSTETCSASIESSHTEGSSFHQQDDNKPVLVFRMFLYEKKDSSNGEMKELVVKLEQVSSTGLQTFENFYAFFRKQIQTVFS